MELTWSLDELLANHDYTKKESFARTLTEDEIVELKDKLSSISVAISIRELSLKTFSDAMKLSDHSRILDVLKNLAELDFGDNGIKVLEAERDQLVSNIRTGKIYVTEDVYGIAYREDNRMFVYDGNGEFLYERELTDDEKIPKMFKK